jgi:hypothetical protein
MSNLEEALAYLQKGLSVIPLWSPSLLETDPPKRYTEEVSRIRQDESIANDEKEKRLRTLMIRTCKQPTVNWSEYQNRLPTKEEVTERFSQYPSANIGIVTGKISDLVVFDLDSQKAEEFANSEGGFPDTARVKTGKGYHLYMKHPGFEIRNQVNKDLEIDIRAEGGYAVAPPSVHGTGSAYKWVEGSSIFQIDPAHCLPWMIDYLQDVAREPKKEISGKV